jgi:phosphoribosylformimino-5-aminoimidazole carboxamide ribotide isomerase
MQVIPVIDLRRGLAVHARRGARSLYRPVRSILCAGASPLDLLRAYRDRLGARTVYLADLDAITGDGHNLDLLAQMAAEVPRVELLVDAGVRGVSDARRLLALGIDKIVLGSESLTSFTPASRLLARLGPDRVVFSIDLRHRTVTWQEGSNEPGDPCAVAARLRASGFRHAIVLEIERIGTGRGVDPAFVSGIVRAASPVRIAVGGGIRNAADLESLRRAGASAALVATAFHDGRLRTADLIAFERGR